MPLCRHLIPLNISYFSGNWIPHSNGRKTTGLCNTSESSALLRKFSLIGKVELFRENQAISGKLVFQFSTNRASVEMRGELEGSSSRLLLAIVTDIMRRTRFKRREHEVRREATIFLFSGKKMVLSLRSQRTLR